MSSSLIALPVKCCSRALQARSEMFSTDYDTIDMQHPQLKWYTETCSRAKEKTRSQKGYPTYWITANSSNLSEVLLRIRTSTNGVGLSISIPLPSSSLIVTAVNIVSQLAAYSSWYAGDACTRLESVEISGKAFRSLNFNSKGRLSRWLLTAAILESERLSDGNCCGGYVKRHEIQIQCV